MPPLQVLNGRRCFCFLFLFSFLVFFFCFLVFSLAILCFLFFWLCVFFVCLDVFSGSITCVFFCSVLCVFLFCVSRLFDLFVFWQCVPVICLTEEMKLVFLGFSWGFLGFAIFGLFRHGFDLSQVGAKLKPMPSARGTTGGVRVYVFPLPNRVVFGVPGIFDPQPSKAVWGLQGLRLQQGQSVA